MSPQSDLDPRDKASNTNGTGIVIIINEYALKYTYVSH